MESIIKLALNTLKLKGYLAYEYNPFHNYRTSVNLYKVNNTLVPEGMAVHSLTGRLLTLNNNKRSWEDEFGLLYQKNDPDIITPIESDKYADAGSLVDLDTTKLNFDLNHPVDITVQPSYDGSVNLILNDGKNIPRLINSRFSVRLKNTYEIVDRIGENDTNIYSDENFDKDSSLYFLYGYNPIIKFNGYISGSLPVGQYCFYLTYCDSDDNESDYIAESGLIPVFIGNLGNAASMDGGIKNQNSNKGINIYLENLDKSYNYIKIYYVRYFADYGQNRVYEGKKIILKYPINSNNIYLLISGSEETEDFDPNLLNISKFNPKNVLTQALCKNMLFFGNIVKNTDNYKELLDCALRIIPKVFLTSIELVDSESYSGNTGYYNSFNIYNRVGYTNLELYRFGVVFIYNNGTLSNVYNTTGGILTSSKNNDTNFYKEGLYSELDIYTLKRNYIQTDEFGWILNPEIYLDTNHNILRLNAKGVCKINYTEEDKLENVYGIDFEIPTEVVEHLKNQLNIRGLFFVRQKRIPNLLCLGLLLPVDEVLQAPTLKLSDNRFIQERFLNNSGIITNNYEERVYNYDIDTTLLKSYALVCPDFLLNLPYYNLIFNSSEFYIQLATNSEGKLSGSSRYYYVNSYNKFENSNSSLKVTLCTVTEDVPTVAIKNKVFRLNIGSAELAYSFRCIGSDTTTYNAGDSDNNSLKGINLFRGIFSPYIAVYSDYQLKVNEIYNIYNSSITSEKELFLIRMNSREPFYAISDRYNFEKLSPSKVGKQLICYRGDCYLNLFTYRLNRNFNDPSLPNNDVIIKANTWKDSYWEGEFDNIYLSDINAVLMGLWITFRVRSLYNYAMRSLDRSYVSEEALMGSPRTYYPRSLYMFLGDYKMPDSYLYNDAYRATLGFKAYFTLSDINYIKNSFSNRILYSAIAILDSFKNNYRESLSTYFRDYSSEYGGIMKLVETGGNLLVVFEHAIALAPINERILASLGEGNPIFINSLNVLPEELIVLTDTYGTLWSESVIKTEAGNIYGVDTIAKKIWRIKGQNVEILSDFKVNKFLIENITLGERENNPIIGLKNVKTHYNNNKKDIMFTFYDDVYSDEEKVWNLCYNELLELFVTFYSWVPSYSENIDTLFFTFNRNTSKVLSLLELGNYNIPDNTGILLDSPILRPLTLSELYNNFSIQIGEGLDITKTINLLNLYLRYNYTGTLKEDIKELFGNIILENQSNRALTIQTVTEITSEDLLNSSDPFTSYSTSGKTHRAFINLPLSIIETGDFCFYTILHYRDVDKNLLRTKILNSDNTYSEVSQVVTELTNVKFELNKDHWGNYKLFTIASSGSPLGSSFPLVLDEEYNYNMLVVTDSEKFIERINKYKYIILNISAKLTDGEQVIGNLGDQTVVLTVENIIEGNILEGGVISESKTNLGLTTDFYLHGKTGIFNVAENLYPTHWYGETHPFEFEFVVNDKIGQLKIFSNLILVSNRAEPESFHFEIEGDNYEFSSDKRNMYFRQEATKQLYQNLGSDILYNRYYTDVASKKYNEEQYYRKKSSEYTDLYLNIDKVYPILSNDEGLSQQVKSTIFPLYYLKINTYNDIYYVYHLMKSNDGTYDFANLSGSEIAWDRDLNLFNIITHIKNSPIDLVGRLRGNSMYKEGKWNIQIPSITFMLKNENKWPDKIPPIIVNSQYLPEDLKENNNLLVSEDIMPNIYTGHKDWSKYLQIGDWTSRKETKIRDKWIKIRVRYSGNNLAIIHSLATLYNISYS